MNVAVLSRFVAASAIDPMPVRSSLIDPALLPVAPVALVDTVHVALGEPPAGTTLSIDGATPPIPLMTRAKFEASTPVTGSENDTVHDSGPVFTACDVPARTIEVKVGAVPSVVTVTVSLLPLVDVQDRWTAVTV